MQFFNHFIVSRLNRATLLFWVPLKGIGFIFLMKLRDTMIIFDIFFYSFSLSIIDFLDLSKMLHIEFVPHLLSDDISWSGVNHQCLHFIFINSKQSHNFIVSALTIDFQTNSYIFSKWQLGGVWVGKSF